jgi:hypothetical protein
MKEKSQLEDMRAAIRGDIERARARREADPWRTQEPEQPLTEAAAQQDAPEPELVPEPEPEPVAQLAEEAPESATLPEEAPEPQPTKKGFWSGLFGRG